MSHKNQHIALLIIDVQVGFTIRDQSGEARSMPKAEEHIAKLLNFFRTNNLPICHVNHLSTEEGSVFTPNTPGAAVQPFAAALDSEKIYVKNVNSAFIGTNLHEDLQAAKIDTLVICGATANHCVETSTRMAGNLGYKVFYVSDAVWAYGATGPDGNYHTAEQVHSMTLANMQDEFAEVALTQDVIEELS